MLHHAELRPSMRTSPFHTANFASRLIRRLCWNR
jgi:hypothetical protein